MKGTPVSIFEASYIKYDGFLAEAERPLTCEEIRAVITSRVNWTRFEFKPSDLNSFYDIADGLESEARKRIPERLPNPGTGRIGSVNLLMFSHGKWAFAYGTAPAEVAMEIKH